MAVSADWTGSRRRMLSRGVCMHLMASEASSCLLAPKNHISNITQNVAVTGIQTVIVSLCKIHLVVLKQIIARDEVVGIRQAGRA